MPDWNAIVEALQSVPVIELHRTLARIVPLGDFVKNSPPDFLYTSGRPNRYNPAGIECFELHELHFDLAFPIHCGFFLPEISHRVRPAT